MAIEVDEDKITQRAGDMKEREQGRFLERTPESRKLYERALRSLPLGVASTFQAGDPYPSYLDRGRGSRVWGVDGNEYVDFHGGFGVNLVGHAHPRIVAAIEEAARSGTHFAVSTPAT